jgi:hypothetical protein
VIGFDVAAGDELMACFADDGDGLAGREDQDRCGGVAAADSEVL